MLSCRDLQVFDRPQGRLASIQPVGKPGAVHDGDAGAVFRPKFCCVIGVAQKSAVIGQDEGVELVTEAIIRSKAGIKDPTKPIGSFLFRGQRRCCVHR